MINLYEETLKMLAVNDLGFEDIRWIGMVENDYTWQLDSFEEHQVKGDVKELFDFFYDNGYGGAEINQGLVVVGDDWWLERHEYDGSEWWEFKHMPRKPELVKEGRTFYDKD